MGLDTHIDAKCGNPLVGTGRGILQQRLWTSALLLENTKTTLELLALIYHFLGSTVRKNVTQLMACCCKDEEHSSCSTTGKKDQYSNGKVLPARKPSLWTCPGKCFYLWATTALGWKKIKIEIYSSPKWYCDASWELSFEYCLLSCPDPSCMCHGQGEYQRG